MAQQQPVTPNLARKHQVRGRKQLKCNHCGMVHWSTVGGGERKSDLSTHFCWKFNREITRSIDPNTGKQYSQTCGRSHECHGECIIINGTLNLTGEQYEKLQEKDALYENLKWEEDVASFMSKINNVILPSKNLLNKSKRKKKLIKMGKEFAAKEKAEEEAEEEKKEKNDNTNSAPSKMIPISTISETYEGNAAADHNTSFIGNGRKRRFNKNLQNKNVKRKSRNNKNKNIKRRSKIEKNKNLKNTKKLKINLSIKRKKKKMIQIFYIHHKQN